jgi:hypothetical protein
MPKTTNVFVWAAALAMFGIAPTATAHAAEPDRAASTRELGLAQAATEQPPRRVVRTRPRIEVYPGRPLHRECVDGYREVWRPHWGTTVVMPFMRCWWVRG